MYERQVLGGTLEKNGDRPVHHLFHLHLHVACLFYMLKLQASLSQDSLCLFFFLFSLCFLNEFCGENRALSHKCKDK